MSTNFLWYAGPSNNGLLTPAFNLFTTEIESLTTGSAIISSSTFTNSTTAQAVYGDIFYYVGNPGIGSALSAGACLSGWFLTSPDGGTTFEQTTVVPPRAPDFIIPLPATTITASVVYKTSAPVLIPALTFKALIQNNTGQTLGTGGTTAPAIKLATYALQY